MSARLHSFGALLFSALFFSAMFAPRAHGQTSVLTHHNDVARTGQNLTETILTPANVNAVTFGRLFNQPVDGSIVAQPLYVPNLQFPNGTVHNVVYVATQHDSVFAFDADNNLGANASPLWTVNYPKSIPETAAFFGCGTPGYTEVGIMGTPVIDPSTQTLYVVSKTLESEKYYFRLHALDLITGAEKFGGPAAISASVAGGAGPIAFNPGVQLQRPALLLLNGAVYIGFGSNGCDVDAYHGWLFAYSASTLQQLGVFNVTPQGAQGALWNSGGGPAVDSEGFIYISTANGTYDFSMGGTDFGDSFLKLSQVQNGFAVQDYFTPYNQSILGSTDLDLGSGGLVILPDQTGAHPHEVVGGGKQGTLYLVDRDHMGGYSAATDLVVQEFVGLTPAIKTVPAYWNGNLYLSGQKDYIKMFTVSGGLLSAAPVQQSSILFNERGPSLSISANGTNNGILWAILHGTPILYAFDATNLSNNLYNTTQALLQRDKITATSRYVVPTIADGHVYVGGLNQLNVFGLLPSISPTTGNNQFAVVASTLPIPLAMQITDAYTHSGIPGVNLTCKDNGAAGKFSVLKGATDNSGNFSTTYTLPLKVKTVTITCSALGYVPAEFTEMALVGSPVSFREVSGTKQTAPVSTPLPAPLVILIKDAHFNPVPGVSVMFSDGGAGGSFSSPTADTNSSGNASVSYTTPPAKTGVIKITATTPGLPNVTFSETVTAATP